LTRPMPRRRNHLRTETRREVMDLHSDRCAFCGCLLLSWEAHHVTFVSLGGSDDPENLMPLCAGCHRQYPHRLRHMFDSRTMHRIQERSIALRNLDRVALGQADDSMEVRVSTLVSPDMRALILASGQYERFHVLTEYLLESLPHIHGTRRLLWARLVGLGEELALHSARLPRRGPRVRSAYAELARGAGRGVADAELGILMSRVVGAAGDKRGEERYLLRARDAVSCDRPEGLTEWTFRAMAFYNGIRGSEQVASLGESFRPATGPLPLRMGNSNIADEVGRMWYRLGNHEEATRWQQRALRGAIEDCHRRGIYMRCIYLALGHLRRQDALSCLAALTLAAQCEAVAPISAPSVEVVRAELATMLGPENLRREWDRLRSVEARDLARLLCGEEHLTSA
jgi:hypothetical protein